MAQVIAFGLTAVAIVAAVTLAVKILLAMVFAEISQARERDVGLNSEIIGAIAGTIQGAVVETVEKVVQTTVKAFLGEPNTPIPQPELLPQGDLTAPEWTTWGDIGDDIDVGVGDSVYFERDHRDAAFIADGESPIPGMAPPDMSGERYQSG